MRGLLDLLKSEKGVAVGLLVVASTALVALGHMTVEQWTAYTRDLAIVYVAGKTVAGGVAMVTGRAKGDSAPAKKRAKMPLQADPSPEGEPA